MFTKFTALALFLLTLSVSIYAQEPTETISTPIKEHFHIATVFEAVYYGGLGISVGVNL